MARQSRRSYGPKIDPRPVDRSITVTELIDQTFQAYNAARLREAAQLFTRKMLEPDVTIGVSVTGALTPAGIGISAYGAGRIRPVWSRRGRPPSRPDRPGGLQQWWRRPRPTVE